MSLPPSPLRLLPTAATVVGWDSHPLKIRAFSRRTINGLLALSWFIENVALRHKFHGLRAPIS